MSLICSRQIGSFRGRAFRQIPKGWGGAEDNESLEVHGRPESVHPEACGATSLTGMGGLRAERTEVIAPDAVLLFELS